MNYNRVVLVGRLTKNPELVAAGKSDLCKFSIAVSRAGGEGTDFIDCEAWSKVAVTIETYLKKGSPVLVEGALKQNTWKNKFGKQSSKLNVSVSRCVFLGAKEEDKESDGF